MEWEEVAERSGLGKTEMFYICRFEYGYQRGISNMCLGKDTQMGERLVHSEKWSTVLRLRSHVYCTIKILGNFFTNLSFCEIDLCGQKVVGLHLGALLLLAACIQIPRQMT